MKEKKYCEDCWQEIAEDEECVTSRVKKWSWEWRIYIVDDVIKCKKCAQSTKPDADE